MPHLPPDAGNIYEFLFLSFSRLSRMLPAWARVSRWYTSFLVLVSSFLTCHREVKSIGKRTICPVAVRSPVVVEPESLKGKDKLFLFMGLWLQEEISIFDLALHV